MKLAAVDLAFGYPEHLVGRDANLDIRDGEVFCLLGPNGCGKTTLFKTLLGLLTPIGGTVWIGGERLCALSRTEVARRMAYVPQAQAMPFPYRVLDVVIMGRVSHRGLFSGPGVEDRHAAFEALAELGIETLADRDVTRLSGGQRQLVTVARAIAQSAPVIVMDEPTASLDFGNQVRVLGEIRKLARRGATVVLSTHNPDHAFAIGDRVAVMRDGQIMAVGTPRDVLTRDRLRTVYGVDIAIEHLAGGATVCVPQYV
jgi:iron complex transport system ATP-binding protein